MRFGASTLFLGERSITEALEAIARLGYASAELWMDHFRSAGQRPATIARHSRTLGLNLTLHAASYDLNIISTNPGIRRESRRQVRSSFELAAVLGASLVVVHPGALSSSKGDRTAAWQSLEETVSLFDAWAEKDGVRVGIENMEKRNKEIFVSPEDVARLFEHPRRSIRLTLDLAHMATVMDPSSYLREIKADWIGHVHLSDNSPAATHLPLGRGQLRVVELVEALSHVYDGIISLEGFNPGEGEALLAHNMAYLRQHGLVEAQRCIEKAGEA
jgi:sugar phosphate isomerase/epimerase